MKRMLSALLAFFLILGILAVSVTVLAIDYYTVTVTGGSGSGQYAEGETVTVTADGQMNYLSVIWPRVSGVNYTDGNVPSRSFLMPAHDVDIQLMYYPSAETADLKEEVASIARSVIGRNYVYGMGGPKDFDNQGLLFYSHRMAGIIIPRLPSEMYPKLISNGFYTEYETISYLAENGVFRHQPEPGDIVVLYKTQVDYEKAVNGQELISDSLNANDSNPNVSAYFSIYTGRSGGTDKVIAIFDNSAPVTEYSVGDLGSYGYGVGVFHIGISQDSTKFNKSETYNGLPVNFEVAKPRGVTSITYEYEGKGDTVYAKSETAPANVGTYTVTITFAMVDGCSQIAPISATLTTSARPVTISPNEQTINYGDTIFQTEFTASGLAEGHSATVTLTPSTNEITTDGTITAGDAKIFADDLDVTANYEISYGPAAKLTVSARPVTISPKEQTINYGDTISQTEFTASGLAEGHSATVTLTPSTNEITTDGTITAGDAKIFADDLDVTAKYEISYGPAAKLTIQSNTSTPSETDPPETSPTETDPFETDPTETDPPETDPTETGQTEGDPTEIAPTKTDPTGHDPTKTTPTETDPPETDPTETAPTETDPSGNDLTETDPTGTNQNESGENKMTQQSTVWIKGSNGPASFTSDADFADFLYVKVDGAIVDKSNYDAQEGSIIITFKPAFLETLSAGHHSVEIVSTSGSAYGNIDIKAKSVKETEPETQPGDTIPPSLTDPSGTEQDNQSVDTTPKTGESSGYYAWLALVLLSAGGLIFIVRRIRFSQ